MNPAQTVVAVPLLKCGDQPLHLVDSSPSCISADRGRTGSPTLHLCLFLQVHAVLLFLQQMDLRGRSNCSVNGSSPVSLRHGYKRTSRNRQTRSDLDVIDLHSLNKACSGSEHENPGLVSGLKVSRSTSWCSSVWRSREAAACRPRWLTGLPNLVLNLAFYCLTLHPPLAGHYQVVWSTTSAMHGVVFSQSCEGPDDVIAARPIIALSPHAGSFCGSMPQYKPSRPLFAMRTSPSFQYTVPASHLPANLFLTSP